ncbi:uncharacterized protein LOC143178244 [Calliopsis andreniformis]|uniref:uncharacterized protein LOC143178244 n=1 Tax=Calliopsis andreniformis TaxID=337506 RepID=UPI003FCC7419
MPLDRSPLRQPEFSPSNSRTEDPTQDQAQNDPGTQESGQQQNSGAINATSSVRLPPFWKENPGLWFAQVEAALSIARISSDDSKYRYVVVHLDQNILPMVSDILIDPPQQNKYQTIKSRIINAFEETNESKLRKLMHGLEISEEKPSNFLQKLRNLSNGQCNDSILRSLFLERLPDNIRSILAISEVSDLQKLALQADKIYEMSKSHISAISSSTNTGTPSLSDVRYKELKTMIEALAENIYTRRSKQKQYRFRHRARSNSRNSKYCFYHQNFAEKARKCTPPCSWRQAPNQAASTHTEN